ncbi:hypothetical protein COV18_03445 [Candidatus Woesearchaeota archaeon CG10_big_fil_rev_8_21_14_0_10_37_12]|nr:MAG: hypothetical protein COV18_03445 [Candidatus Woesearchaeota archaeon CG10_big_fil_rev_8_21_14_0_10_37_12]
MKLANLQKFLQRECIDFALFIDEAYAKYFSGVSFEKGCLIVPANSLPLLLIPGFEAGRLEKFARVLVKKAKLWDDLKSIVSGKKCGVVSNNISYSIVQKLQDWNCSVVCIDEFCTRLRLTKTSEEIIQIRNACDLTDQIFKNVCDMLTNDTSELEVANFIKNQINELGLEPSFSPIVASGKNAAVPHHIPTNKKLEGFTIVDFGVIYHNYCSDMTRTVFVGLPSEEEKKLYADVLDVQLKCISQARVGKNFDDIDDFAKEQLPLLVHRIGHSLGVEVHDVQGSPLILQEGMCVTIEPGSYSPGKFGIRIEDDLLITKSGAEVLTKSTKELICINKKI